MEIYKRKYIQETKGVNNAGILSLWAATSCTKICVTHLTIIHHCQKLDEAERVRTAVSLCTSIWERFGLNLGRNTNYPEFLLLLFILSANGFSPGGSSATIRHNTQITQPSNETQHTKLHTQ
jgi:hypothetical protein